MKRTYAAAVALTWATVMAGAAVAQTPAPSGKTREQVRAELEEAQRTGDIVVNNEAGDEFGMSGSGTGRKLNEIYPSRYPAKPVVAGKTRAQVRAELEEAQRTGDIVVNKEFPEEYMGSTGRKLNEIYPNRYRGK